MQTGHPPTKFRELQLTDDAVGHCLNSTQSFSPDGNKIVYDTRNDDSALAANGSIRIIDLHSGKDELIYQTANQSAFGPGVGAATFSPDGKHVLFLGGIPNCDEQNPYSFTRRTGIAVNLDAPMIPICMDARDIVAPFTAGALRGGTHAHTWSGDGQWISFTYNDHILAEAAKRDTNIIDTRTVGIMFPRNVTPLSADGVENRSGIMYSVIVTPVVKHPKPGSDEISKAFDECWIGVNGYTKENGKRQLRAIAYQGHVINNAGKMITDLFVADIPADLPAQIEINASGGTGKTLPAIPSAVRQRRITHLEEGISAVPRHWLRSLPDGSRIGFLASDGRGIIQLFMISPNGGEVTQVTHLSNSIEGPFNFSSSGKWVAFIAGGAVQVTRIADSKTLIVSKQKELCGPPIGAVQWSPDDQQLCYNRYVLKNGKKWLQIFLANVAELHAPD